MDRQYIIFEKIKGDFQLLSKIVLNQFNLCRQQLETGEVSMSEVESNEGIIDSIEVKLRSEVISTIVLHSPRAIDLRKIVAYYDMTANMERIGDHLLNISEQLIAVQRKGAIFAKVNSEVLLLFNEVETMTKNAIYAFACEDNALAKKTITDDDKADDINSHILAMLSTPTIERALTASELSDLLAIGAISYNLERIGDNATNIAESAIYITEGRDIKHKN